MLAELIAGLNATLDAIQSKGARKTIKPSQRFTRLPTKRACTNGILSKQINAMNNVKQSWHAYGRRRQSRFGI